jgi:hypothetical protein
MHTAVNKEKNLHISPENERLPTKFRRIVLLKSRATFIDIQSPSPDCICF